MTKFGLLIIPIFTLSLGLAACSGGGTPTAAPGGDPSQPTDPADPTSPEFRQARMDLRNAQQTIMELETELQTAPAAERAVVTWRLAVERANEKSLMANVNLLTAQSRLAAAETAAERASTEAARTALGEAVRLLADAVREAQAARDDAAAVGDAPTGASAAAQLRALDVQTATARFFAQVQIFQVAANRRIEAVRQLVPSTGEPDSGPYSLTRRLGPVAGEPGTAPYVGSAAIVAHPRAANDGTALPDADRLEIQQDAVPYSDGKRVISADSPGSTDELPLRQVTVRIGTTTAGDVKIQGQDGTGETYSNTDGVPVSSIRMDGNRIIYKYGGVGVAFHDNQRRFDIGSSIDAWESLGADLLPNTDDDENCWQKDLAKCTAWNFDDLSVTWTGTPGTDPGGERSYYWSSRVPLRGQSAQHSNLLNYFRKGRTLWDLGLYELWVTNYGGVDRQLEYPKGRRYAEDDVEQFLSYAAYGMFVHTDTLADLSTAALPSRMQGFHFGYDAFEDAEGKKTTDISSPVNLSFQGKTMALMYQHFDNKNPLRVDLRADIILNARIGSGANTISGEFLNFEQLAPEGVWVRWDEAIRIRQTGENEPDKHHRLVLAGRDYKSDSGTWEQDYSTDGAKINADGSYEGGIFHQYWTGSAWRTISWVFDSSASWTEWCAAPANGCYDDYPTSFDASPATFSGTLYGPRDNLNELETAGYWYLPGDTRKKRWGGIVGSFGAVQIPSEE